MFGLLSGSGAQTLGRDGVDKRISAPVAVIEMRASLEDLEEVELCYTTPFGGVKNLVNFAGMIAADLLSGARPLPSLDGSAAREVPR